MMPRKQPQPRHAEHGREKAAPAAVPQALRHTRHPDKRPNAACAGGFQRRHIGKHHITRHERRDGRLGRKGLGDGGKMRSRELLRRDSRQHRHQRVAAGLLQDRLARAAKRKHAGSSREVLGQEILASAGRDARHPELPRLTQVCQDKIVMDIPGYFRLGLVEMTGQARPHNGIQSHFLGQLVGTRDMIVEERRRRNRQKRVSMGRMPRRHAQPDSSQARHSNNRCF